MKYPANETVSPLPVQLRRAPQPTAKCCSCAVASGAIFLSLPCSPLRPSVSRVWEATSPAHWSPAREDLTGGARFFHLAGRPELSAKWRTHGWGSAAYDLSASAALLKLPVGTAGAIPNQGPVVNRAKPDGRRCHGAGHNVLACSVAFRSVSIPGRNAA